MIPAAHRLPNTWQHGILPGSDVLPNTTAAAGRQMRKYISKFFIFTLYLRKNITGGALRGKWHLGRETVPKATNVLLVKQEATKAY